jgi:hypothetical protein
LARADFENSIGERHAVKSNHIWQRLAVAVLAAFALPAFAAGQRQVVPGSGLPRDKPEDVMARESVPVTVEQLEQVLASEHGRPDKKVAERLGNLELTQRLSTAQLERLKAGLPGEKSRLALIALADASAFLDLPAKDISSNDAPDAATQRQIMSRAVDFVASTVSRMPDFFATRTTIRFQDMKVFPGDNPTIFASYHGYFVMDKLSTPVTYRNGQEVLESPGEKRHGGGASSTRGLATWGVFGPLLGSVMTDVLNGKVGWGHWEKGSTGPLAVFRYAVPKDKASYVVRYCCFQTKWGWGEMGGFKTVPAYHGEIAIDPASGAVLRLVLKTDLQPEFPIKRSDVLVEYGPVEIGGKIFICPVKSISITKTGKSVFSERTFHDGNILKQAGANDGPLMTAINDVIFYNYHQFRSEVRILPADSAGPE